MPPKRASRSRSPRQGKRLRSLARAPHLAVPVEPHDQFLLGIAIASAVKQHSTGAGWAAAPRDILQLVLVLIPFRPRILVLSLVCRSWRNAVKHFPTGMPRGLSASAFRKGLSLLSAVVSIEDLPASVKAPPTLRHLRVNFEGMGVEQVATVTGLTSLHVSALGSHISMEVYKNNANTISTLSLDMSQSSHQLPEHSRHFLSLNFPALSTLSFHLRPLTPLSQRSFCSVISRYSSQLTSLSIYGGRVWWLDALATMSFPRLTHLAVLAPASADEPPPLVDLVSHTPTLRTLGLSPSYPSFPTQMLPWASKITDLHLTADALRSYADLGQFVVACVQLTSLTMLHARLEAFELSAVQDYQQVRLVEAASLGARMDVQFLFPRLTTLSLTDELLLRDAIGLLLRLTAYGSPSLRKITLWTRPDSKQPTLNIKKRFCQALTRAEEAGLERITINTTSEPHCNLLKSLVPPTLRWLEVEVLRPLL